MNNSKLYIPKKCKVGLQKRDDTYTKKLGYVIYHDGKIWRKETSWENWRHKEGQIENEYDYKTKEWSKTTITGVEPIEFENIPTEGFVLNKKAGGYSTGWNHRNTYCRVYDPRGWEFEISIENLLFILENSDSYKGKGLTGEFVYSWLGTELVLLPTSSVDYKNSMEFTNITNKSISTKDLTPGYTYYDNSAKEVIYLGKFISYEYPSGTEFEYKFKNYRYNYGKEYYSYKPNRESFINPKHKSVHVFKYFNYEYNEYLFLTTLKKIKTLCSDEINDKFPYFIEEYEKSIYYSPISHYELTPIEYNSDEVLKYDKDLIYGFVYHKNFNYKDKISEGDIPSLYQNQYFVRYSYDKDKKYYLEKPNRDKLLLSIDEIKESYLRLVRVYKNNFKEII